MLAKRSEVLGGLAIVGGLANVEALDRRVHVSHGMHDRHEHDELLARIEEVALGDKTGALVFELIGGVDERSSPAGKIHVFQRGAALSEIQRVQLSNLGDARGELAVGVFERRHDIVELEDAFPFLPEAKPRISGLFVLGLALNPTVDGDTLQPRSTLACRRLDALALFGQIGHDAADFGGLPSSPGNLASDHVGRVVEFLARHRLEKALHPPQALADTGGLEERIDRFATPARRCELSFFDDLDVGLFVSKSFRDHLAGRVDRGVGQGQVDFAPDPNPGLDIRRLGQLTRIQAREHSVLELAFF